MPLWTLTGLIEGRATTSWPRADGPDGQEGVLGMPRFDTAACADGCHACADVCPTAAITCDATEAVQVDYGRCIACQLCVEACPTGAVSATNDWAFGVAERSDLILSDRLRIAEAVPAEAAPRHGFRRSLHIRHVDAGSCNGCESELQTLNNPFYNLHRLGIFFTASPRHADLLLVTGPVTEAMRSPLLRTYEAMPSPKWVMATGTCAISGALTGGGVTGGHGLTELLPVDIFLPGSPPNPAAIMSALLLLLDRMPQRVKGGRLG
jgi:Ni,Fe-hydrogenase III small subunit/Pyruvate/2-oxoacid:ferredoxin oxidoreductase delta subunit